ncbi:TRAP transporter large permease [Marinicellulosiphila megalodicopiae]|uniref:TRAP transporter large permease n=1 Tax=Marinicellulosiphila megalodicopiae TaxID=2724896 RepID=UPI003BB112D2
MKITISSVLVLLLIVFSAPLFVVIISGAGIGWFSTGAEIEDFALQTYFTIMGGFTDSSSASVLKTLPLFAFAGFLLSESKTADRLIRLSQASLGWMPGGLVLVSLLTCAFFTMLTGGSGVTIVAVGGLLYPALVKSNYNERFSLGLITTSGSLGLLLPPAIPLILFSVIAQQMEVNVEISDLFLAGILPAFLMIAVLFGWGLWANRNQDIPLHAFRLKEFLSALWEAKWELMIPVVIIGGIATGKVVISEIAAVTAMYVFIITVFVQKEIPLSKVSQIALDSMKMVGGILLILAVALVFSAYLIDAQIPSMLLSWIQEHVDSKWQFLILLNILLLLLGAILDIFAALVIMVPLLLPVAVGFGVDPVHLAIIFVANMQIGYFTPPVGMNLFIASSRFNKSIGELYRATLPYLFLLFAVVLLITYVPWFSLVFVA